MHSQASGIDLNRDPPNPSRWGESDEEWEDKKNTILRLYQNRSLSEVISIMAAEHQFKATPRQYKKRFRKWGIRSGIGAGAVIGRRSDWFTGRRSDWLTVGRSENKASPAAYSEFTERLSRMPSTPLGTSHVGSFQMRDAVFEAFYFDKNAYSPIEDLKEAQSFPAATLPKSSEGNYVFFRHAKRSSSVLMIVPRVIAGADNCYYEAWHYAIRYQTERSALVDETLLTPIPSFNGSLGGDYFDLLEQASPFEESDIGFGEVRIKNIIHRIRDSEERSHLSQNHVSSFMIASWILAFALPSDFVTPGKDSRALLRIARILSRLFNTDFITEINSCVYTPDSRVQDIKALVTQYLHDLLRITSDRFAKAFISALTVETLKSQLAREILQYLRPAPERRDESPDSEPGDSSLYVILEEPSHVRPALGNTPNRKIEIESLGNADSHEDNKGSESSNERKVKKRRAWTFSVDETMLEKLILHDDAIPKLDLHQYVLLLPLELRSLVRVIASLPKGSVGFEASESSICNTLKCSIEDKTFPLWSWWPLEPSRQQLSKCEVRMIWTCHCGQRLWKNIPLRYKGTFERLSMNGEIFGAADHLCKHHAQPRGLSGLKHRFWQLKGLYSNWASIPNSSPTTAIDQITIPSGSTSTNPREEKPDSLPPLDPSQDNTMKEISCQQDLSLPMTSLQQSLFVMFGVKGPRRTLELAQIGTKEQGDDCTFFTELRRKHKSLRGFWRYWFSVWRLSHCNFVKFKKLRAKRIIYDGRGMLMDKDLDKYVFIPKPPSKDGQPITPHEFEIALSFCNDSCKLSFLHDCIEPPIGCLATQRIPKRKGPLHLNVDVVEEAWGIQAQYAISFVHVVLYHVLILSATLSFWAWWQSRYPGDLQNASVPLTIAPVLLSLFWSSAGVLKVLREPA